MQCILSELLREMYQTNICIAFFIIQSLLTTLILQILLTLEKTHILPLETEIELCSIEFMKGICIFLLCVAFFSLCACVFPDVLSKACDKAALLWMTFDLYCPLETVPQFSQFHRRAEVKEASKGPSSPNPCSSRATQSRLHRTMYHQYHQV